MQQCVNQSNLITCRIVKVAGYYACYCIKEYFSPQLQTWLSTNKVHTSRSYYSCEYTGSAINFCKVTL